ncbi:hypothetical protein D3C86_1734340 [compost metagenome]
MIDKIIRKYVCTMLVISEEFIFPAGLPKVRFIRPKVLENWGEGSFMTKEEITTNIKHI